MCERTGLQDISLPESLCQPIEETAIICCVILKSLLPSLGLVSMLVQDVLETHTLRAHTISKPAPLWAHTQETFRTPSGRQGACLPWNFPPLALSLPLSLLLLFLSLFYDFYQRQTA